MSPASRDAMLSTASRDSFVFRALRISSREIKIVSKASELVGGNLKLKLVLIQTCGLSCYPRALT